MERRPLRLRAGDSGGRSPGDHHRRRRRGAGKGIAGRASRARALSRDRRADVEHPGDRPRAAAGSQFGRNGLFPHWEDFFMKRLLLVSAISMMAFAQDDSTPPNGRDQARSMVMTKFGIVATSQTLASQAGARILEEGGNAIDAALAANATLGVVEPAMNGMGGDLFAIIYEAKTGKIYGLNSSGWTPAALTLDLLKQRGITDAAKLGVHRVTVPGAVAGWQALHDKFGTMGFDKLLAPAIYWAENGYPVTELIGQDWGASTKRLATEPGFKETYMPGGRA